MLGTWNKISAPRLQKVAAHSRHEDNAPLQFCFRHKLIKWLEYSSWTDDEEFKAIAESLVDLEYLDTGVDLRKVYTQIDSDIPLPKLKELTIDDTGLHRLSVGEFDTFVRTRLLPQAQCPSVLKRLRIIVIGNEMERLSWRKSALLLHFHETYESFHNGRSVRYVVLEPK